MERVLVNIAATKVVVECAELSFAFILGVRRSYLCRIPTCNLPNGSHDFL
jgi:hypothetical protein